MYLFLPLSLSFSVSLFLSPGGDGGDGGDGDGGDGEHLE